MTTAAQSIAATKRLVLSGHREQRNKLATTVGTSDTTFGFTYDLAKLAGGARLSVDIEVLYVWSVDATAKTAVVDRAQEGTTAAAHSAGAIVTVDPIVGDFDAFDAINDELDDLSSPMNGLFRVRTLDLSYNSMVSGYDLTGVTNVADIIDLRWETTGPSKLWPRITDYEVVRNMATTEFASGTALMVREAADQGSTVRVSYRAPFTALATVADDVEVVSGLHAQAHDLLPLGAAIRLASSRPIKRTFTESQGEPRRAEEVPTQDTLTAPTGLRQLRRDRINAESARLRAMYPTRLA